MKIKKGDIVKIMTGKDRGKSGKVLVVFPKENKITTEGINLMKKHKRAKRANEKGQTVEVPKPMNISKIMLVCPHCGKPTRVGFKINENKTKFRICKKCKAEV